MALYTGAYLFLQEDDKWWLVRGVSNDFTVWVDAGTGKAMDNPPSFEEPWQVLALGGMPAFDDIRVPLERILDNGLFEVEQAEIIDEQEDSYGQGWSAVIFAKVRSLQKSDHHLATTREYHLFDHNELNSIADQLGERDYTKPLLELMLSLDDGTFVRKKSSRGTITVSEVPDNLDTNKPVKSKTFYIPIIVNSSGDRIIGSVVNGMSQMLSYASRVLKGQTLQDAIKGDLQKDFQYRGNFTVISSHFHDTKSDNQGVECDRYIVNVALLNDYNPKGRRLFGKDLEWITQDSPR